ncbi:Subtilisin-like protease SBT5.3, partial [Linum perenne]
GSFHAIRHVISVICSAGNSGPLDSTISNVAPWDIMVASSTTEREFPSYVVVGNRMRFKVSFNFGCFVHVSCVERNECVMYFHLTGREFVTSSPSKEKILPYYYQRCICKTS